MTSLTLAQVSITPVGQGNKLCEDLNKNMAKSLGGPVNMSDISVITALENRDGVFGWVSGYISGRILEMNRGNLTRNTDVNELDDFVTSYCKGNPSAPIFRAGDAFIGVLTSGAR
ncbi:MAG: hypothetical protein ABSC06_40155 [Rhodopila sp.]|jgi:hypothetical protein